MAVRNRDDDPLIKAMWLVLAKKSVAIEERARHELTPPPANSSSTRATRNHQRANGTATTGTASSTASSRTASSSAGRGPAGAASGPPGARSRTTRPTGLVVFVRPERGDRANQVERDNVLRRARGERRMDVRWCRKNMDWTGALLRAVEPTVEELSLHCPSDDHVRAVQAMPLLQRLSIRCDAYSRIILVPETPRGHAGLRWLSVWRLPRPTLRSLLSAHARTLETLWLFVGTRGPATARWPFACPDVHVLLDECRLLALRRLVLARNTEASTPHGDHIHHSASACAQQRAAVRAVLMQTEVEVLCDVCDHVRLEEF
ncbi:uncharacterized protein LOC127748951 isoform X2 [Frankliniella occidentalis]|nr:uncharacterized protein LOC127748951 isoform X2 [Frankliniella occidentalis]